MKAKLTNERIDLCKPCHNFSKKKIRYMDTEITTINLVMIIIADLQLQFSIYAFH